MTSIPEMNSSENIGSNDDCSIVRTLHNENSNSPTDPSTKSNRDKEGDMGMDVQEGHSNPRSLGYLHNFSDLIASSDIKPVDLNDPDVDNLWFGSGQIGNKAPSSVLSGTKTAPTEEVSGCRNNPPHGALAETAERSESGTANHFLCPPIKVERDLVMDNNLCEFVALEKVKVEADELVDVARAGTSANSFTPNTKEPTEGGLHTRKGSEIMVLDAQSEEVHTRIKTVPPPDDERNSVQDSTVNDGGNTVKKRGRPKKQTNKAEVPTRKIPKVSSTCIDNSIELDMDSTLKDGGKTVKKRGRQRKQVNNAEVPTTSKMPKVSPIDNSIELDMDCTSQDGGNTVKKRGRPRKQANNAEVPISKMPKVSSTSIDNLIKLDIDSTLEDGGKTVRKRGHQRKQANYKSDTNPLSTMIMERRKSSRTPKPKKYSYDIEIDVDGDGRGEEDSEEEWTMPQELMKSPVQITVPYKNKTPRKAKVPSAVKKSSVVNRVTYKKVEQVCCKNCKAAFASHSDCKVHELQCRAVSISTAESTKLETYCPVCHRSFSKLHAVRRHLFGVHCDLFHISCGLCHKKFGHIKNVIEHMQLEHQSVPPKTTGKKEYHCPLCGETTDILCSLREHFSRSHADLLHLSCVLCERNVGSPLDFFHHLNAFHMSSSSSGSSFSEICITPKETEGSNSVTKEYVCSKCNKCVDSYNSFTFHMLFHKIRENRDSVIKGLNTAGITHTLTQQESASSADTDSNQLGDGAKSLEELPVSSSSSQTSANYVVAPSLGEEVNAASNSSLQAIMKLSSSLSSELKWDNSAPIRLKDDLGTKLNTMLRLSSGITDISKSLLLVLGEGSTTTKGYAPITLTGEDGNCQSEDIDIVENGFGDNNDSDSNSDEEGNGRKAPVLGLKAESESAAKASAVASDERRIDASCCTENQNESSVKGSVGSICCPGNGENATETQEIPEDEDEGNNDGHVPAMETSDNVSDVLAASENNDPNDTSEDVKPESTLRPTTTTTRSSKPRGLSADKSKKGKQPARQKKKFICNICGKHLSRATKLTRHKVIHSDLRPFKCDICPSAFKLRETLKQHIQMHARDDRYKCDFCDFHSRTLKELHEHMVEHKDEKLFPCDVCNHQARTSYDLAIHKKTHEPKSCPDCDYKAKDYNELKAHKRRTHLNFVCSQCAYRCATNLQLKRHMKTHDETTTEILCCELCGKTFTTRARLRYHMERHVNKTPFSCPHCDYKCSSKTSYKGHLLKHAGIRPYVCKICGAAFRTPSTLKSHSLQHSDETRFACRFCSKGFKYGYNLKEHEMIHTGEKRFKCSLCDFGCQRNKIFVQHMEEHKANGSDVEPSELKEEI